MAQPRTRGTRVSLAQAIALALGAFALALVLRPSGGLGSLVRVVLVSIALVLGSGLAWLAVLLGSAYFVDKGAASAEAGGARASGARAVWRRQPFMFTTSAAWFQLRTQQTWLDSASGYDRAARGPSVSDSAALEAAVDQLVVLVLRDFVLKWFTSISSSRAFPLAVEKTLRETLARAAELLADVDVAGTLVGHLLPLANTHIDLFERAERVLRGADGRARLTTSDELDLFLAAKYAGLAQGGSLHPAIDVASPTSKPTEEAWLRQFVARLLPKVLPSEEAASPAVFVMVREILACAVLYPVIDLLSDPDFWNRLIDVKAGDAIREQHLVTEFRKALDQQGSNIDVAALSGRRQAKEPFGEAISVHTTRKDFDQFIRAIAKCTSLLEARRTANDLSRLIRQTQSVLSEIRVDDVAETRPDARRETDYQAFLERLQVAKAKADHRIQELGGMRTASAQSDAKAQDDEATVALRDILLQPASLSYFMEFQDRRRRSVRPQFWVLVEGLKDPLENEPDAASDNEEAVVPIPPSKAATAADDIRMVWDMYLANCLIEVDERLTNTIETFVSNRDKPVDLKQLYRARRAVFAAQREIFAEMEAQDFSAFQGTELYFKAVSNMAPTTTPPGTLSRPTVRRSLSHPAPASEPLVSPPISSPPISRPMQLSSSATSSQLNTRPSTAVALTSALQQRTDTAPPQVTVKPLFENESSLGLGHATRPSLSRPSSVRSNDSVHGHRRVSPMSDSLDFLMHASATEDDASRPPLFQEDVVTPAEKQTMDAIQDALSTLLEADAKGTTVEGKKRPELASRVAMTPEALSPTGSTILERPAERLPSPSATTFSRAATSKRKRIFDDDDDDRYDADEALDADGADTAPLTGLSAASVDKGALPAEIKRLAGEIAKLEKQEAVVQALIRKAELTGRASELKILVKSRESLRREISGLTFQKMQYESQDAESKLLPGRTKVTLPGTTQGRTGLQTYQLYLIEVRQLSTEGTLSRGWMISRRYSEFFSLHAALRERFPQVRALDLPGKRLVSHKNESFVEERRAGLEKYLQSLLGMPAVCQSMDLQVFLSKQNISLPVVSSEPRARLSAFPLPGQTAVRTLARSLAAGIEELVGGQSASMMDTVIGRLLQQASDFAGHGREPLSEEDLVRQGDGAGLAALDVREETLTSFTTPICDTFINLFDLKEKNNWLRRQAILLILQQLLGGTIERKFRETIASFCQPEQLADYVKSVQDAMWPGGELRAREAPRTSTQKAETRDSASRKLSALMPDIAANLIGRSNARHAARKLFAVLQNRRLNKHLLYSMLDEVAAAQ